LLADPAVARPSHVGTLWLRRAKPKPSLGLAVPLDGSEHRIEYFN
jgi:hypothetical protein